MFRKIKQEVEDKVKIVATKTAVATIKEYLPVIKLVALGIIFLGSGGAACMSKPEPIINVFVGGGKNA